MSSAPMVSRQRMLAALHCQPADHVPCSFMLFKGLWARSGTYLDFIQGQLDLGLDAFVQLPPRQPGSGYHLNLPKVSRPGLARESYNLHGLPVHFHPAVTVAEWKESRPDERWPILIKEYRTPSGILRAEVNQDEGWPYGDHVPFLDDYVETRARKFIVESRDDLKSLRYLLVPPSPEVIAAFRDDSRPVLEFARQHDLLATGGWGVGADLIGWVFGLQRMIYAVYDQPNFIHELLGLIDDWNRNRMRVVLKAGVDLYIKRAWYENCDFWSPKVWRSFIFPILKADVELAHEHGALFGYLITANCMPLLDMIAEAKVDVVIGVDPASWNLAVARQKLAGKVCLWGGVNGHLTVERDTLEAVQTEVREAFRILAAGGGFILSPVDNVRELNEVSQRNVQALIQEWQRLTDQR